MPKPTYEIEPQGDKWWIFSSSDDEGMIGPYDTKREAEDDARGLRRFHRHKNDPDFATSEAPK